MITHEVKIRVRYKDTDKMGVVYHSNYIVYYEEARTEMFRSIGIPYSELEAQGIMTPTVFSQAALHNMPTRALSLPPELPNTMPETPELFTSSRMKLTRPSNSA